MSEEVQGGPPPRAVRRDRLRNRDRLIEAARNVFAGDGIHAPLDHIATTAGVGAGTLYRHFPTRAALWTAVLVEPLQRHLALVEESLAAPDPWEGLSEFVRGTCEIDAGRGGYADLMNTRFDNAPELWELRVRIQRGITRLFARAHATGAIRADVTAEDLLFITLANASIVESTRDVAPDAWRRNVALFLDALRPEGATPLPTPPLTPRQLARIVTPREG